jgi:ribosomal protein L22
MSAEDEQDKIAEEPDLTPASAETVKSPAEAESSSEAAAGDSLERQYVDESETVAADAAPAADEAVEEVPKRARRARRAEAGGEDRPERKPRAKRGTSKAKPEEPKAKRPAPRPRRGRSRRKPGEPLPVVRAQAKYVRSSARKARLVCDHIRGKSVEDARAILAHTSRAVAHDWSKLLESAVANAEHNHELVGEDLYVKAVRADEGPTIKRFRPRAQGRATRIRKRTAHLTILLTPKD